MTAHPADAPSPGSSPLPYSEAAQRNQAPILEVLDALLPSRARILEVAAGYGQHAAHFAGQRKHWQWQPTEADPTRLPVMAARCSGLPNVAPPLLLDLLADPAPSSTAQQSFDAVYCANMLHASPSETTAGLMACAAAALKPGGLLLVYGPFIVEGETLAPSNMAFDADLRSRDPRWGLRQLGQVQQAAAAVGLRAHQKIRMPSNNLVVSWRRPV